MPGGIIQAAYRPFHEEKISHIPLARTFPGDFGFVEANENRVFFAAGIKIGGR
jgi:hypothetical protein